MFFPSQESEHEASRRLKTEFMTQVDGASTTAGDRLLISKCEIVAMSFSYYKTEMSDVGM